MIRHLFTITDACILYKFHRHFSFVTHWLSSSLSAIRTQEKVQIAGSSMPGLFVLGQLF